jgi:hypothetical protein
VRRGLQHGGDDREALAHALRLVRDPNVGAGVDQVDLGLRGDSLLPDLGQQTAQVLPGGFVVVVRGEVDRDLFDPLEGLGLRIRDRLARLQELLHLLEDLKLAAEAFAAHLDLDEGLPELPRRADGAGAVAPVGNGDRRDQGRPEGRVGRRQDFEVAADREDAQANCLVPVEIGLVNGPEDLTQLDRILDDPLGGGDEEFLGLLVLLLVHPLELLELGVDVLESETRVLSDGPERVGLLLQELLDQRRGEAEPQTTQVLGGGDLVLRLDDPEAFAPPDGKRQ